MKKLLLLAVVGILFSCQKPGDEVLKDGNGVVTRLPHLWKSSTSPDGKIMSGLMAQHIYDGSYLLSAQRAVQGGDNYLPDNLSFKSIDSGENAWVWNDRFTSKESDFITNYHIYAYQDLLFLKNSFRFYCINQKTGKTVWRKEWDRNFDSQITMESDYNGRIGRTLLFSWHITRDIRKKTVGKRALMRATWPRAKFVKLPN